MSWLTKAVKDAKKWVQKGSGAVASFSQKAGKVVHSINTGMDKFGSSTVGKALLDVIPEGHVIYNTISKGTHLAEKGLKGVESVARGVGTLSKSKNLSQAINDGKKLYNRSKKGFDEGVSEASSLEKRRKKFPSMKTHLKKFTLGGG